MTFNIVPATGAVSPPFGSFDTPVGDATVLSGSVAVTGWTLDNIGVSRVELFFFDWSTLTNGSHTIGWLITDDCGRADGVGSRFFNVTNDTNLLADFHLKAEATGPFSVASAFRRNETEVAPPLAGTKPR